MTGKECGQSCPQNNELIRSLPHASPASKDSNLSIDRFLGLDPPTDGPRTTYVSMPTRRSRADQISPDKAAKAPRGLRAPVFRF